MTNYHSEKELFQELRKDIRLASLQYPKQKERYSVESFEELAECLVEKNPSCVSANE